MAERSAPAVPVVEASWPAPERVRAFTTLRAGGVSGAPYASLNLAEHVADDPRAVAANRARLRRLLPSPPRWLTQVHGTRVVQASHDPAASAGGRPAPPPEADAAVALAPGLVCAVLTADCLPLALCDRRGTRVGLAHVGWRGLVEGVIERAVHALEARPADLLAWLGPAIGPDAYEVGDDVRRRFLAADPGSEACFAPGRPARWQADLFACTRRRLVGLGVTSISGGEHCTYADPDRFFSYRRDGTTGRMATVAWIAPPGPADPGRPAAPR